MILSKQLYACAGVLKFQVSFLRSKVMYIHGIIRIKSLLVFILSSFVFVCLQGCEEKDAPSLVYENQCQNDLVAIEQAIQGIKQERDSEDTLESKEAGGESHLYGINAALIRIDNVLNRSRLDESLFADTELQEAAVQCELSGLEQKQSLFSDVEIYSSISNLNLSESLVTAQHFHNKLLSFFREYGAGKKDSEREKILQYQNTLAKLEIDQRRCDIDGVVTSCFDLAETINDTKYHLSQILGYPKQSIKSLDQSMALGEDSVVNFINRIESRIKPVKDKLDAENFRNQSLLYSQFRDGVFEAITSLFHIELLPANRDVGADDTTLLFNSADYMVDSQRIDRYNVIKDGKIIGYLNINILETPSLSMNNQFYPVKKGIKGSHTASDQLPEGAIVLGLEASNNENTLERLMSVGVANEFVGMLGEYLALLLSGEQELVLNSGIAVEKDFKYVPRYMLQQWLYRPKLVKKILADNKKIHPENFSQQIQQNDFLQIRKQLITAKIRIHYLTLGDDMPLAEKEKEVKSTLQKMSVNFSIHLSDEEVDSIIESALTCYSYCYESLWSKMIAMDTMTAINQWDELDQVMVGRFMERILVPGASRTAEDGVSDFLGRSYSDKVFLDYLSSSFSN